MRRPNWIVSGVLLLTMLGGSALAATIAYTQCLRGVPKAQ